MEAIIVVIGMILAYFGYSTYYKMQYKKQKRQEIRKSFGKKPEPKEKDTKKIRFFLENRGKEAQVDDITWKDLSMDEVFWRINNCASATGEQILYDTMHNTDSTEEELEELEESVQYFSEHEKERNETLECLQRIGKKEASYYISPYMENLEVSKIGNITVYRILQILPICFLIGLLVSKNIFFAGFLAANLILNIVIYAMMKMRYENNLAMLGTISAILTTGKHLEKMNLEEVFAKKLSEPLQALKKAEGNIEKMQSAQETMLSADMGALGDYLLGATLWHLIAYEKSIQMLVQYRKEYMEIFETIGKIDMAISIASFRKSISFYITPEFWEKREVLLEEAYHPLIENPVCNSINWNQNCIITGSNASGKSTFIKLLGVNVILAQTIHTCMAQKMQLPHTDIVTSMAVQDDIMSGDSYFIKEIKYLKRMLEHLNENRCTICIVDEILRGTNTKERIAASQAIMEYLCEKNCLVMVASHDQELTVLLQNKYQNYHFSEKIGQHDIEFDYKLYPGPSTSQNAIRLLEYLGFPKKIITKAKEKAEI